MARKTRRHAVPVQNLIEKDVSYLRFLHGVPTVPTVDLYADGQLIYSGLSYGDVTPYLKLPAGNVLITIYRTGTNDDLIGILNVNLPEGSIFTVVGIGFPSRLEVLQVPDTVPPPQSGTSSFLRFVNLASDAPPMDLTVDGMQTILQNVAYKDISLYRRLTPGEHILDFSASASGLRILPPFPIDLDPAMLYTVYIVGFNDGENADREIVILTDGLLENGEV